MTSTSIGTISPAAPAPRRWYAWPLPALATWSLAWALFGLLGRAGAPPWLAAVVTTVAAAGCSLLARTRLRAWVCAAGFPVSLLASGVMPDLPGWAWVPPLALLWLLYPRSAWRDAPWFPTPPHALDGLSTKVVLSPGARVLDAGCGLGHGLRALRHAYPRARIEGVERSGPLALAARVRCRFAAVRRGDMWTQDWSGYRLVYLFQRPESMARAIAKARAEMADGSWLASLEFEAEGWRPQAVLPCADARSLWLYRLPVRAAPISSGAGPGR